MVLLKASEAVVTASKIYLSAEDAEKDHELAERLGTIEVDSPVEHLDLINLSRFLVKQHSAEGTVSVRSYRLDVLLRGTNVYVSPPPPKPEPSPEYKALMQRLRKEEEQRQYERMTIAPIKESFGPRKPEAFNPNLTHGHTDIEVDEITYQDIDRQLTLIINVLVTVIASGVTIWFAARYWAVPQRLALALIGSFAIAVAEVVVYMGYIRRLKDAKSIEKKKVEKKERRHSTSKGKTSIMRSKNFHHPFQPYDIQQEFMQAVYDCIEDGKVGIFESPTGTGKSLSLICGSLTWLREHKRKLFDTSMQHIDADDDEPAWLLEHARAAKHKDALALRSNFESRLEQMRSREQAIRKRADRSEPAQKKAKLDVSTHDEDDDFALNEYNSDGEDLSAGEMSQYSAGTTQLLQKLGMMGTKQDKGDEVVIEEEVKVFFASRTHSQLSQLIGELRRVQLPATLPAVDQAQASPPMERLRQIALGSRKNLCINPRVNKLTTQTAINERCLELQRGSSEQKCPYLPKQDTPALLLDFRDTALADIRDIEDLGDVGKRMEICPYYASRAAIAPAEVVTLPYPLLLQKASREALGVSLKGSVVIIDEAHNLVSAVESAYATQISSTQLQSARFDLIAYLQKYRNRLAGSNRTYVAQLIRIIDSLLAAATSLQEAAGKLLPGVLLAGKGVDQINVPKLVRYISESKIARKVEGFAAHRKTASAAADTTVAETPTLTLLANFLMSLINPTDEGSFFWSRDSDSVVLKYLLLDPSQHFREIIDDARAVILVGGTMSPMNDHKQQLFPHLTDVRTLSCGHIVPASSLLVRAVSQDVSGTFEFNYKTRTDVQLMQRVGALICSLAQHVVGGMVVFFSSYSYLEAVQQEWTKSGTLTRLQGVKTAFFDSRTQSAETIFQAYSDAVRNTSGGAVLCSVLGGKLSEGINFSDELGRCVVVVGLPYPNLKTPEWEAKMQYLERKSQLKPEQQQHDVRREFAENVCMRAVNQAIGRAIRHKNDWASIVLVDTRYARPRIEAKLPAWIRGSLPSTSASSSASSVKDLLVDLQKFFIAHQSVTS